VAVVVFDADVLIGFLGSDDPHHADAVARVRASLAPGTIRLVCSVNYSEVLIGPLEKLGPQGCQTVDAMLARLSIDVVGADAQLAREAASVRARTKLKLPDSYALATALQASRGGQAEVRVETFDKQVIKAYKTVGQTNS
jgi:predicted nucleic acid-binding protein